MVDNVFVGTGHKRQLWAHRFESRRQAGFAHLKRRRFAGRFKASSACGSTSGAWSKPRFLPSAKPLSAADDGTTPWLHALRRGHRPA